jgi:long-chain acyl-CoA synthetase
MRITSGYRDLVAEIHVLDRVQKGNPFLHGPLECLAARDQAGSPRALVDHGRPDRLVQIPCPGTGAAGIDPNVLRGFEDLGFTMMQGYGLTECSPLVSGPPDFCNRYKKAGSVGPAVASGEIKIVDKDEDGIGEIIFKGPNVMLGYYNMPERTAEVLKDGWFYTGDLGFLDDEGWLYITGRKKNVIVTKTGKNIYPEEVEYYINRSKYIQESLVHGLFDEESDDTQVSVQIRPNYDVIYEEFGETFGEEEVQSLIRRVIAEINEKLPIYKRVRNIIVRRDEFVKTTTKKIQRHKNV